MGHLKFNSSKVKTEITLNVRESASTMGSSIAADHLFERKPHYRKDSDESFSVRQSSVLGAAQYVNEFDVHSTQESMQDNVSVDDQGQEQGLLYE